MKICHLITRMIIGGAQENTLLTVKGLRERGHEVVLLTGPTEGPEGRLLDADTRENVDVKEIPELVRNISPAKDISAYLELLKFFRIHKFDVVHTHSSKAGFLGRLAASRAGVPVIVHTVHGQPFNAYQSSVHNFFYTQAEKLAARHCSHIFTVASAMIDQAVEAGIASRDKYSVVYSGMDIKPYLNVETDEQLRAKLKIPPEAPVIGKVARLFKLKGHDFLIDIAEKVVEKEPTTRFLLVGDGNLRGELEEKVKRRGLGDNFIFTGLVPPDEIPRYLSVMNVLVHLSLREGLPRSVVQAQAAALPVVGYDLDGTPEVIDHGASGYICPPKSIDEVADALCCLIENLRHAARMGQVGQERVREQFDDEHMVKQLEKEYRRLWHIYSGVL